MVEMTLNKMLGTLGEKVGDGIWEKTLGICTFFTLPEYTVNLVDLGICKIYTPCSEFD